MTRCFAVCHELLEGALGSSLGGARNQGDVWFFDKPRVNDLHPTMKPVELIERAISNSSRPGDIVLDAFGGSGSTLIACEKTRRRARLIELDPLYVDVMVAHSQRIANSRDSEIDDRLDSISAICALIVPCDGAYYGPECGRRVNTQTRLSGYFFNTAVQFCTNVSGAAGFCSPGTTARKRCPSAEAS